MLTNQDRRRILDEVKASGSGDIIAALRGQVMPDNVEQAVPEAVEIPQQRRRPVRIPRQETRTSDLVDSTTSMPTQLAQTGGLRQHMMNYMHFRGSDTTNVNLVMNAIGQHESKNITDAYQDEGGPGRGAYQFEIGDKQGANTAMNRTANFLASPANKTYFGSNKTMKDFPNLYDKYISGKSQDFSKLSREDQDALFLGDKIYGGADRRDEFDKAINNPTQENVFMYWLNNHKGKVNGKTVQNLTKDEIDVERKKWNERTKNIF